jgi:hypothetical protein
LVVITDIKKDEPAELPPKSGDTGKKKKPVKLGSIVLNQDK